LIAVFEILCVAGLEPLGQALGSDAASGFGQFVNDDGRLTLQKQGERRKREVGVRELVFAGANGGI